jgi:hypothetical protein
MWMWGLRASRWPGACIESEAMRSGLVWVALPALVAGCDEEPSFSSHVDIDPACGDVVGDLVVAEIGCEAEVLLSVNGISERADWELNAVLPGQPDAFFQVPEDGGLGLSWTAERVPGGWRAPAGPMRFQLVDPVASDAGPPRPATAFATRVIDPARAPAAYIRAVSWISATDDQGAIGQVECGDALGIQVALGGDVAAVGSVGAALVDVDFLGADKLGDMVLERDAAAPHRWKGTWRPPCAGDAEGLGGNDLVFHARLSDRSGAPLDDMRSTEIDGPAL